MYVVVLIVTLRIFLYKRELINVPTKAYFLMFMEAERSFQTTTHFYFRSTNSYYGVLNSTSKFVY